MVVAAKLGAERRNPTAQERQVLRGYSGWGGLSIEGAASRFPEGFPAAFPQDEAALYRDFSG